MFTKDFTNSFYILQKYKKYKNNDNDNDNVNDIQVSFVSPLRGPTNLSCACGGRYREV